MKTLEEILATAAKMMGNNQYPIVTYDIDIEQSDYDAKNGVIRLGTLVKGDYRDYAIIAEEICHADQDRDGYWAMRLAVWGVFPSIFQYLVEKDAKQRAKSILTDLINTWGYDEYQEMCDYLDESLLAYRKKTFGI